VTAPFAKSRPGAPAGFFAVEAAGLAWLRAAGGPAVPDVLEVGRERIVLDRVTEVAPTAHAAEELGWGLARMHRAGAPHHGAPPAGWSTDGFIATLPLPHQVEDHGLGWPEFYAAQRVTPFLRLARDRGAVDADGAAAVERVCARLTAGVLPVPPAEPARLHGDLWTGNVLWSASGPVLVDPAAHGGHRETDLAMLALFGLPHLDRVLAAYDEAWPLDDGWRDRVALHQLHPLLVHAALFGGGYGRQAVSAAAAYK
jgi:fructosamine-3-kinase